MTVDFIVCATAWRKLLAHVNSQRTEPVFESQGKSSAFLTPARNFCHRALDVESGNSQSARQSQDFDIVSGVVVAEVAERPVAVVEIPGWLTFQAANTDA